MHAQHTAENAKKQFGDFLGEKITPAAPAADRFRELWDLGFKRLVPIIPPDAKLSERSSLHKRKDARGKAVGIRGHDGLWRGLDWINYEADELDLHRWHKTGAGVGIKTGEGLVAIDADTLDVDLATTIRDLTEAHFGRLPVRVGKAPKALYVLRTTEPVPYTRIEFGEPKPERVEILSDGRQFVAYGKHPQTKRDYHWPVPPSRLADIPQVSREQIDAYMADLQRQLPKARPPQTEGVGEHRIPPQESLRGELETVRKAVAAIPNSGDDFTNREIYVQMGYAIKAALPDDPDEAFAIFEDWCARWDGGANKPDIVEADWHRMKPPFRRGASWLYDKAHELAPDKFNLAHVWFDDLVDKPSPVSEMFPLPTMNRPEDASDTYPVLTVTDLKNRPPPVWLIERHIPEHSLGFIYSDPGAGKSFLALDMALHIATGRPHWNGDAIRAPAGASVLYIAGEGAFDFGVRVAAWFEQHNADPEAARFALIEQSVNFMRPGDIEKLIRTIDAKLQSRPALIVVDTVSRAIPGADENLQKEMSQFVAACDAIKDRYKTAVLGIHHAGKSGEMRGSTVFGGAVDYCFSLKRPKGAKIGTFLCEKMKAQPDGWKERYNFNSVELQNGLTSLVVSRADAAPADLPASVELTAKEEAVMQRLRECVTGTGREYFSTKDIAQDFHDLLNSGDLVNALRKHLISLAAKGAIEKHRQGKWRLKATGSAPEVHQNDGTLSGLSASAIFDVHQSAPKVYGGVFH